MENSIIKRVTRATRKKSPVIRFAFVFALAGLSFTAQAGKITSIPSASGAEGFAGWNLDNNVEVVLNGTQGVVGDALNSWFDELTGDYNFATNSNFSYVANVDDAAGSAMGKVLAKDWPVGEPPGIKVINDDIGVKAPRPANCIMATSYLADHYLDSGDPQQVTCSGPFQSHKRYKLAMLPASVDGIGAEGIDLVFNVEAEAGVRDYQVFQKINNWTDGRLQGFRVQVGVGVGATFQTASEAGISLDNLKLSVPDEIWSKDQLAVFSEGLFGPLDNHTRSVGFFDPLQRAGFLIDEYGSTALTDTLTATTTLASNYAEVPAGASNQFGPWIANNMLPYGVFFDDDGNPETDAQLLAWYGYNPALGALGWMGGADSNFAEITAAEIEAMGANLAYTMDVIDDLVNVGLNYLVTVGDVRTFGGPPFTFTIRVIPTKDSSAAGDPPYVGATPNPELVFTNQDADVLLEPAGTFPIGALLTARVGDADLNLDPFAIESVDVVIATSTGLSETLTLLEQGENRGVFAAILPDEYSNVDVGTTVTMTYLDADTGTASNIKKISSTTATAESAATDSSGCSCAYSPDGSVDPLLPGLVVASLIYLGWRSRSSGVKSTLNSTTMD
jgi:hypothetical protein